MADRADALVLFGITGDLAAKKLIGSLYKLTRRGHLPPTVIGVASTDWGIDELRAHVRRSLEATEVTIDEAVFAELSASLSYVAGDYRDKLTFQRLAQKLGDVRLPVCYLAIPPSLFGDVVEGLASIGLGKKARVVLEKPFGRDLASAQELNQTLHRNFPEEAIYRIDHFLGKEAVQNLMVFRFANTILEPVWNRHYIDSVQITMAESFGVEARGGFYDGVGAIRDVVQNHLLQVIALLAMEPPVSESSKALRNERVKVFDAMHQIEPDDFVRGQYEGYRSEAGVEATSDTETFVALRAEIDSWRWAGVPWYIRTGKRLRSTVTEAVVEFKSPPRLLFADPTCAPHPNHLRFQLKPGHGIGLGMQAKKPGDALLSHSIPLQVVEPHESPDAHDAYERLLDDALSGDARLFAGEDGVEAAWRVVQPLTSDQRQVKPYQPGTWGPASDIVPNGGWHDISEDET